MRASEIMPITIECDDIEKLRALTLDPKVAARIGEMVANGVVAGIIFCAKSELLDAVGKRSEAIAHREMRKAYNAAHDAMVTGAQ